MVDEYLQSESPNGNQQRNIKMSFFRHSSRYFNVSGTHRPQYYKQVHINQRCGAGAARSQSYFWLEPDFPNSAFFTTITKAFEANDDNILSRESESAGFHKLGKKDRPGIVADPDPTKKCQKTKNLSKKLHKYIFVTDTRNLRSFSY